MKNINRKYAAIAGVVVILICLATAFGLSRDGNKSQNYGFPFKRNAQNEPYSGPRKTSAQAQTVYYNCPTSATTGSAYDKKWAIVVDCYKIIPLVGCGASVSVTVPVDQNLVFRNVGTVNRTVIQPTKADPTAVPTPSFALTPGYWFATKWNGTGSHVLKFNTVACNKTGRVANIVNITVQ